jgi:hypothetical protein
VYITIDLLDGDELDQLVPFEVKTLPEVPAVAG